jgi:heterotetrameric sarcosine oxidase gamma subunit
MRRSRDRGYSNTNWIMSELVIKRCAPRSISLLQIHGGDIDAMVPRITHLLGDLAVQRGISTGQCVYAIGPAEWLLIGYSLEDMRRRLIADLGRSLVRLTDVSSAFTSLRVEGAGARILLGNDAAASWAARSSGSGQYVRTRLAEFEIILRCIDADSFELHVDRGTADNLEAWMSAQHDIEISNRTLQ